MARAGMVDLYHKDKPDEPVEFWPVDAKHALSFSDEWSNASKAQKDENEAQAAVKAAVMAQKSKAKSAE